MSSQPQNSAQAESSAQPWLPRLCGPRRAKRQKISADQELEPGWHEYCKKLFESDEEQDARDAKKKEEEEKRKAAKGPPEPRRKWALSKSEKEMLEEHERMKSKSE